VLRIFELADAYWVMVVILFYSVGY
jgi:hypothetical protein